MENILDSKTPISFFKEKVKNFVDARKWSKYHTPKNLVQAINCEAGELSQLLLFKAHRIEEVKKDQKLVSDLSDEIADVFIYLISLINVLDIDLSQAFFRKMEKNKRKYSVEEFNDGKYFKK